MPRDISVGFAVITAVVDVNLTLPKLLSLIKHYYFVLYILLCRTVDLDQSNH